MTVFGLLLGLLFFSTSKTMAQVTGYNYRKQITIQASQVPSTQTNFPVLISITDTNLRDNVQNTNGYDIRFASDAAGNTVLSEQIESYDSSTGKLVVWVKVPSVSGSANTSIYMFYGKTGVTTNPSSTATWTSQYNSVYHFQNNITDATATGNNGTNHNSTNVTSGKIGSARQFNGTNAYVEVSQDLSQVLGVNGTVSAWVKTTQTGNNTVYLAPGLTGIEEAGGGNDIFYGHINNAGRFGITAGNGNTAYSTNALNSNQWYYVVFTRNGTNGQVRIYVNGALNNTVTSDTGNKTNAFHSIGRIEDTGGTPEYYNGSIDEFRVSSQIFNADLITTTYNNQNTPANFYVVGSQQFIAGADLALTKTDSNDPVYTGAIFTYSLQVSNNGSQTATGISLSDNLPTGVTYQSVSSSQGSCTGGSTVSCNLGSLTNGQTAQVEITVKANSAGTASNTASVTANEDDPNSGNNSDTETTTISNVESYRCYAVAGEGGSGNSSDRLDFINTQNHTLQTIGLTGTQNIQASVYNSATGVMYAANANRLGTINLTSGAFSARPNTFGTAGGSAGNVNLNNVVGLAYLSDSGTMVGIHQRNGQDLAFLIDVSTGQHVANAFANNVDYYAIADPNGLENLNDIASLNGYLYAVVNNMSRQNDRLIRINPNNLSIIDIGRINQNGNGINDVEGLGISGSGQLVATTGSNEAAYVINTTNAQATLITNLAGNDYGAVDCISLSSTRSSDLDVGNTVSDATPNIGDTITYTVTVYNGGPDLATYVQITDQVPTGVTYVSSNASQGSFDASNNNWFVGNLNAGSTVTLTIQATVDSGTAGTTISNTAAIGYAGQNDPQSNNNSVTVNITPQNPDNTPPGVPQNVTAAAVAAGNITVTFDDLNETGSGVASYSIKRSPTQGGPYTEVGTVTDDESANYSYTDNSTTEGTTYYYVVTAIDGSSNEGDESAETSAMPDATAPSLQTTSIVGDALQLDYDEPLGSASVPVTGDFTVKVNGSPRSVTGVAISGDKVNLTLSSAVDPGDTITLNYTAGTNPIEDVAGNEAANLNNQSVLNQSDITPPALSSTTVNGSSLKLLYDEALDESSVPSASDYSVGSRTITDVEINGNIVNLTLDPAAVSGDNVQVSYTAGTSPVRDLAGNDAADLSGETATNNTFSNSGFGPNPCPITNGQDAGWACFDGLNNGTTMSAYVGDLKIATVDAASGSATTFAPNAIQQWNSGAFSGDEYNGPQANATGNSGDATSFDINIPAGVPSNALILALNRLGPDGGGTSYTLEAFDGSGTKVTVNDWVTGQGTDGGICTNTVNLAYANGNTTIDFQPTVSGNPSCSSSSTPIWFRIKDANVRRIEIRKTTSNPDNVYIGLAVVADFGDAPNTYGTTYSSRTPTPAFHLLDSNANNTVYFGSGVDADGNGISSPNADGDDSETGSLGSGDDEDGISSLPDLTTADTQYSVTLSCTTGANVGGWVDFDKSNSFDFSEFASGTCSAGSVTLTWTGLSGMVTGQTYARFRIATNSADVANPTGSAADGEVEDYPVNIIEAAQTDLEISKTVDKTTPVVGDTLSFTVELLNNGPDDATGIQVSDQLPSGLTYISSTPDQGTYDNSTGLWDIGNVSATNTVSLVVTAKVDAGTSGQTLTNAASVSAHNETDPNLSNNTASSGVTVVEAATDLEVTMIVDENQPTEAQHINYTVNIINNGPRDATTIKLGDQLPTGLTFVSSSPNIGTYSSSTGIWTIGSLPNGGLASLVLEVQIDQGTENSTLTNTATINSADQGDDNVVNNTASADVTVKPASYPTSCSDIPNLTFHDPQRISGAAGQVGAVYEFQDVAPGIDAEVEIVTINNTTLDNIDVQQSEAGVESNFQPQLETTNTNQEGYMDFEIRFKQQSNSNPAFLTFAASAVDVDGDSQNNIEYDGFQRLTSFVIESTSNLGVSSSGIYTTFTPGSADAIDGIDPNNTDNLALTTYTNEPQFRIRAGITNPANNGAQQRYFAFNFDPCLSFNDGVSTNIVDIGITKSVDNVNPHEGDTINYTVSATNLQGNVVNNVEVQDQLPSGLSFVSATPSTGSYNSSSGIWDLGNMQGQQAANLTIQATVDNNQAGSTITNTAELTDSHSGVDGNTTNNSATVDISVIDPGSPEVCTEPPYFSFMNPVLETGLAGQVGAVYRFNSVHSGVDALVEITDITNAQLNDIDSGTNVNQTTDFSPGFNLQNGNNPGYIDWQITFVQSGTSTPVKQDFAMSALNVDGASRSGGSQTTEDFIGFTQNQFSTVELGGQLTPSTDAPFQIYTSSDTGGANGTLDPDYTAYIKYKYTSSLSLRTGTNSNNGYTRDRQMDFDFRSCVNQNFTTPKTTPQNADVAVTKTADNTNATPGETVNFTVTATNNGPQSATGLDIHEALPSGLALVTATPSQGSYNQINKIWTIGTLNTSASATLTLKTTVNSGVAADSLLNKAFVNGFNQNDTNTANDTSKVTVHISVPLKGTVFEDKTGDAATDGDTNFGDANGDQQARANVRVLLFKDGGDGIANGTDDAYVGADTTSSTGAYNFKVVKNSTYWVAVDSRSAGLSNGTTWAEQTYAPAGGLCTDGAGTTAPLTSAGVCYGGRLGDASDAISEVPTSADLANAEHVAKITVVGSQITGINFGFSYNVVTNVGDGDDDTGSARSVQGSLRQFIQNANSILGGNSMRFVPVVATNATGSGNWWSITLGSALPAVNDALTTIDGKAYDLGNPTTERDTDSGTIGSGGTVGIDQVSLSTFERKELEVNLNDVGNNAFEINSTGAVTVRRLALYNNSSTLDISQTSSGVIEKNFIGARADGTDPAGALRADNGISFGGSSSTSVLVQQNYVAFAAANGIESGDTNASVELTKNEIYQNGLSDDEGDGVAGLGTWTIQQNLIYQNGNSSSQPVNGGSGIELGSSSGSTQNNQIKNNTIRNNTTAGITVLNSVSATLISKNIINTNGTNYSSGSSQLGSGVKLTTPASQTQQGINITQNSFYTNYGLAVDVVKTYSGGANSGQADGVNVNNGSLQPASTVPNRELDYPVFTLVTLENSTLHVEGYVGTYNTHLSGPFTVEVYKADDDGNNDGLIETGNSLVRPHGEGKTFIKALTTNADGTFSQDITVGGSINVALNDRVTALAFNGSSNTSEFSSNQRVVPTGIAVSGYVYNDNNQSSSRESTETGIPSVTLVLYNINENNCKSVQTDANGFYEFGNVLNGTYKVVEAFGETLPTPNACPATAADAAGYISTTSNTQSLTVNNLPASQDFGDFEGSKIQGKVFNDNGISSGTANNVVLDGGEQGIYATVVKALNGSTVITQATTAADGSFTLYISKTAAPDGSTVKLDEVNSSNFISIGGDPGSTGGSYNLSTDEITFTNTVGTSYTGLNYADVQESVLLTNGQQNLLPGSSGTFQHTFQSKTAGSVKFSTQAVNNPTSNNFSVVLYKDTNANGSIDTGEPILSSSTAVQVDANQTVNLIVKVTVPQGAQAGASSNTTLNASFTLSNTSPAIQQSLSRNDLVNVADINAGLSITKSVDKEEALPGSTLTYTVNYVNNGDHPLSALKIQDPVPPYTTFLSSSYGTLPDNLTDCTITKPNVGETGSVVWTFTGTLAPGASGTVSYQVTIQN